MRLFHSTSRQAAAAIEGEGFRDGHGTYLTQEWWSGVWLSDWPLGANDGVQRPEVLLVIEAPEAAVAEYEWIEEGKSYREFLVPAAVVNRHPVIDSGDWDDLTSDKYPDFWPTPMSANAHFGSNIADFEALTVAEVEGWIVAAEARLAIVTVAGVRTISPTNDHAAAWRSDGPKLLRLMRREGAATVGELPEARRAQFGRLGTPIVSAPFGRKRG